MKAVLSICIPTFNRLHYLKESLDSLLPQAQRLAVEVRVSDNHSADGTGGYLREMAGRFPCLQYRLQDENIGIDRNMLSVISMGTGRYVFPMGDDDYLPEGALERILGALEEDFDLIALDGWHTDAALSPTTRHLPQELRGKIFSVPSEAFSGLWDKLPFGSFLVERSGLSAESPEGYVGTSHAYAGVVWEALAKKYRETGRCRVKCLSEPVILLRVGEKSWRNEAAAIKLYEIPLWFASIKKNEAYASVAASLLNAYIRTQTRWMPLIGFRASGQLNGKLIDRLGDIYSSRQIGLMRIVSLLPAKLAERALAAYFGTRGLARRMLGR